MAFCTFCGKQIPEDSRLCPYCGVARNQQPQQPYAQPMHPPYPPVYNPYQPIPQSSNTSVVLGILGIVCAWLLALAGHVLSIIGIVLGCKEYRNTGKMTGLTLSILGEVCSVISSLIGIAIMSSAY